MSELNELSKDSLAKIANNLKIEYTHIDNREQLIIKIKEYCHQNDIELQHIINTCNGVNKINGFDKKKTTNAMLDNIKQLIIKIKDYFQKKPVGNLLVFILICSSLGLLLFISSTYSTEFGWVAALVSIAAFIFCLLAGVIYEGQEVKFKFKNFVFLTILLILLIIIVKYVDDKIVFLDWGNVATLLGCIATVLFFYFDKAASRKFVEDYYGTILLSLFLIEGMFFLYHVVFQVSGEVTLNGKPLKNAAVKIINFSSKRQKDICSIYNSSVTSGCDGVFNKTIKGIRICETETNDDGEFFLRVFSVSKENIKFEVNISSFFRKEYEYKDIKNIVITEDEFLSSTDIKGTWECDINDPDRKIYLKIPQSKSVDYLNIEPFEGIITSIIQVEKESGNFEEIQVSSNKSKNLKKFYSFSGYRFDGKDKFFYDYKTKRFKNTTNYIRGVLENGNLKIKIRNEYPMCCKKNK